MSEYRILDEEVHARAARVLLKQVSQDDIIAWKAHPLTKALIHIVRRDQLALMSLWIAGAYSSEESIDATAQRSAEARGRMKSADEFIDAILSINQTKDELLEHGH